MGLLRKRSERKDRPASARAPKETVHDEEEHTAATEEPTAADDAATATTEPAHKPGESRDVLGPLPGMVPPPATRRQSSEGSSRGRRGSLRSLMSATAPPELGVEPSFDPGLTGPEVVSRRQSSDGYGQYLDESSFEDLAQQSSFGGFGAPAPTLVAMWEYIEAYNTELEDAPEVEDGLRKVRTRPTDTVSMAALSPAPATGALAGASGSGAARPPLSSAPQLAGKKGFGSRGKGKDIGGGLSVLVHTKDTESTNVTIREDLNLCVGIVGYRVVRRRGPFRVNLDYAQYHVILSTSLRLHAVWRRHSEFRRLGDKIRPLFLVETMEAWSQLQKVRTNFKPLDQEFLKQRAVVLENFLATLVMEMPDREIIVEFCIDPEPTGRRKAKGSSAH